MRVLGVDPGSIRMGYGCIETECGRLVCVEAGTITASARKTVYERIGEIGADLAGVLSDLQPDVVVLERGFVNVIGGKLQQGTLVSAAARGVAGYLAARAGVPVVEYAPASVKKAVTGRGNAAKPDVALFVQKLLRLRKTPAPDAADALAVAICHAQLQPALDRIERAAAGAA